MKAILVILLHLYCVYGAYDKIERKERDSHGAPAGDCMIQRLTPGISAVKQVFWFERQDRLLYSEEKRNVVNQWQYDSGRVSYLSMKEIIGERLAFIMPTKNNANQAIVASDLNIRIMQSRTQLKSYSNMSDPVITLKDKGYCIHTGHCDRNGVLYLVSNYKLKSSDPAKGSFFYRIKNKQAERIKQFDTKIYDFVFSHDYTNCFVIAHYGKTVEKYDFDIETGMLSTGNHTKFFNITWGDKGRGTSMTSIEIDTKGNVWVAADDGVIRKLNPLGAIIKVVETPYCSLTSMTFGGYINENLLVGTKRQCSPEMQAGTVLHISGVNAKGELDQLINW